MAALAMRRFSIAGRRALSIFGSGTFPVAVPRALLIPVVLRPPTLSALGGPAPDLIRGCTAPALPFARGTARAVALRGSLRSCLRVMGRA